MKKIILNLIILFTKVSIVFAEFADEKFVFNAGQSNYEMVDKNAVLVRSARQSESKKDIFDAMARCAKQSKEECVGAIAQFEDQLNKPAKVCSSRRLFYLGIPDGVKEFNDCELLSPIKIAVKAGMPQALEGLVANGADPSQIQSDTKQNLLHLMLEHLIDQKLKDDRDRWAGPRRSSLFLDNKTLEFVENDPMPWGKAYRYRQDDYIEIIKSLVAKAGPQIVNQKSLFNGTVIGSASIIEGSYPDISEYLYKLNGIQLPKKDSKPEVLEAADQRNKRAMAARLAVYPKCGWKNWLTSYDKDRYNNDELLKLLDSGKTICQKTQV